MKNKIKSWELKEGPHPRFKNHMYFLVLRYADNKLEVRSFFSSGLRAEAVRSLGL